MSLASLSIIVISDDIYFLDGFQSSSTESEQNFRNNEITSILKSTNDPFEVLNFLQHAKFENFEPHHLPQALNKLLTIQKSGDNSVHPKELVQHEAFDKIFLLLKKYAQHMKAQDLVTCFKVLNYFELSNDSLAMKRVLNLIKDQLNDLSPASLAFLNYLLTKGLRTPLTEAIVIAIPIVFNHNLSLKLDYENTSELVEILRYMTFLKVSSRSATNLATALALHGETLNVEEALAIIRILATMRNYDPVYDKVLHNCLSVVSKNIQELPFEAIDLTLLKMTSALANGNESFYVDKFYDLCVSELIRRDAGYLSASFILKKFNRILYVSFELLDYIDRKIVENHSNISTSKLVGLISFAAGFSNANYKPKNWEIIKSLLHENPMMGSDLINIPWLRFALDLMAMGFHSDILIQKVFSTSFLKQFLNRRDNVLDQRQLLLVWQCVKLLLPDYKGPWPDQRFIDKAISNNILQSNETFEAILVDTFGDINEVVQKNVFTSHGHCLDFVISFDVNENPIAMPCRIKKFDEIPKSQVKSVAVLFQNTRAFTLNYPQRARGVEELRQKTLQALGIRTAHISARAFYEMPDTEKISFLDREVRFALR